MIARVETVGVNAHLYDALFSSLPLRLTLGGLELELSTDEAGSLNVHRLLERMKERGKADGAGDGVAAAFDRPVRLEITRGRIHISPVDRGILLDASVSWSGDAADPMELLMTWGDGQNPSLNVSARLEHLLDGEDPIGNVRVEFAQLDLAPWTSILRALVGVSPAGIVSRGTVIGIFEGAAKSSIAASLDLRALAVPDIDLAGADLTRDVHLRVRASREQGRVVLRKGTATTWRCSE